MGVHEKVSISIVWYQDVPASKHMFRRDHGQVLAREMPGRGQGGKEGALSWVERRVKGVGGRG